MIRKDKGLRKICRNYEMVDNYKAAIADETQVWDLHHRREIDEMKSAKQLKDEGRYYDVEPSDLIFILHSEHTKLHMINALPETRNKMSKSQSGENHPLYGKHCSDYTKKKLSEALKGEKNGMFGKIGENHPQFGWHWWNNGKVAIKSKEQPGEDFVRGRL